MSVIQTWFHRWNSYINICKLTSFTNNHRLTINNIYSEIMSFISNNKVNTGLIDNIHINSNIHSIINTIWNSHINFCRCLNYLKCIIVWRCSVVSSLTIINSNIIVTSIKSGNYKWIIINKIINYYISTNSNIYKLII